MHDFGSILRYTEVNFGMPYIDGIDKVYADYNAPDSQNGNVPLSDFFPLSPKLGQGRTFTYISTPDDYKCFQNHQKGTNCELDSSWVAGDPDDY